MKTPEFGLSPLSVLDRDTAPNPARLRAETLLLDGTWTLRVNGGPVQPVQVPFPPQAQVNGIEVPDGEARLDYATTVELPTGWPGALLHLEGVDHEAEVIVNGVTVARHKGAWDPFEVFLPRDVLERGIPDATGGATTLHALQVLVRDHSHDRTILAGKQERERGEGAIFYANMSGLWKSAWIERAGPTRLGALRLVAGANGRLEASIEVLGAAEGHVVTLTLAHPEGGGLALAGAVAGGQATLSGQVEGVRPWSPEAPHLYFGALALRSPQGETLDRFETYAGFRDFVMRDGYYRLNGRPFYLQGLLNQAIYPDSLYTPTDRHTLTDFERTREQGFGGERRHQTTPRHRDLWLADRLGYWLSIEMPCARNLLRPDHRAEAVEEWQRIVRAYAWNHPSVLFLVAGNEDWGLLEHAQHRVASTPRDREAFQVELGAATEEAAPPRMPYAANDGWRMVTARKWGQRINRLDPSRLMLNIHDYASNAKLRSTYGRIARFPRPGTWGRNPRHVFHSADYSYDGQTPVMLSEVGGRALLNRTSRGVFAYGRIHRDPEAWATELSQLIGLMGELPVVRGGYVLTQTRDAGNDPEDPSSRGEINGILDGHGLPKYAGPLVREANARALALWQAGLAENRLAAE